MIDTHREARTEPRRRRGADEPPQRSEEARPQDGLTAYATRKSALALSLFFAACSGTPTAEETEARRDVADVAARYRPDDRPPAAPALGVESPASDFVRYAVIRNPEVERRFHEWRAAVEEITVARSLPDPSISFGLDVGSMLSSLMPAFEAVFPPQERLASAASAQRAASDADRAVFEQAVVDVAAETWSAYFEAALVEETLTVNREIGLLLGELEELVGARLRVGMATQQDALRIGIERDELATEIRTLEDLRSVLKARLARLLGWPFGQGEPPLPARFPPESSTLPDDESLVDRLVASNREIAASAAELREAEALVTLARTTGRPEFMASLGAELVSPKMLKPEIGFTLPLWRDKVEATIAGAAARRDAKRSDWESVRLSRIESLADALFQWRDAGRRRALAVDRALPKARAALETARTAYASSKADVTDLLDAERSVRVFRVAAIRARADRETAWARIVYRLLSVPPPGPDLRSSPSNRSDP